VSISRAASLKKSRQVATPPPPPIIRHCYLSNRPLTCDRTFTYIFLLDSAFLIFNNAPPKLMVQKLEMDLTCPEEIFQAESAESCFNLWQFNQLGLFSDPWGSFSLVRAIEILASSDSFPTNTARFSKMTTLNLFAIISGMYRHQLYRSAVRRTHYARISHYPISAPNTFPMPTLKP